MEIFMTNFLTEIIVNVNARRIIDFINHHIEFICKKNNTVIQKSGIDIIGAFAARGLLHYNGYKCHILISFNIVIKAAESQETLTLGCKKHLWFTQ